ncbi:hypothetical protein RclHR1_21360001 [Rhizophagus clarus]|uniref:Uncharacterized protein n=1 Tax=Rhizophagus clarus TaxID=94130 RepID=A0A2Z6R648_9GLOM|nr:hypothetical protein RclHR1_21360001 [Rhizophagus clarus]
MKFNLFLLFLIIHSIVVLAVPSILTKRDCPERCEDCGIGVICCSSDDTCKALGPSAYCDYADENPCSALTGNKCGTCSRH